MNLKDFLLEKKLIVCVGAGGVGKTTISASIAYHLAMLGKRVLVVTIDPARRLADSLGIKKNLGNEIREIDIGASCKGRLSAMMLDSKKTFDDTIARYAHSQTERQKIMSSVLYEHISTALSRTHEYMALEKLYELHERDEYDHIVLDTPPTKNALDFLDAPQRMLDFCNDKVFKWFTIGRSNIPVLRYGRKKVIGLLDRILDRGNLGLAMEFISNISGLLEGLRNRIMRVSDALRFSTTTFLLITSTERNNVLEAQYFLKKLKDYHLDIHYVIVNRCFFYENIDNPFRDTIAAYPGRNSFLRTDENETFCEALDIMHRRFRFLHHKDNLHMQMLKNTMAMPVILLYVSMMSSDIHDLDGIALLSEELFK